ncbi:MAG: hypothetical protein U9O98_00125 [Asgard group archaeon]|nr:hypothetical protein [Asgard group archaeon]
MKKGLKIILIIAPIAVLVIFGGIFGGTLLYTKNNVSYVVGDATLTEYIQPSIESYFGYIVVSVPIEITNNGLYAIENLNLYLTVAGQAFTLSSLNGLELGTGNNTIGTIKKKTTWSGNLEINMTQNIATLAIQDGEMKITVEGTLNLDVLLFKIPNSFMDEQIKEWDSPFGF